MAISSRGPLAVSLSHGMTQQFHQFTSHLRSKLKSVVGCLDLETTQILLSSSSLTIQDEDSLYDFVSSRSENDLRFTTVFEFISFDYLSVDRIENFSSFVKENFLEDTSVGLWTRICGGLIPDTKRNLRVILPPGIEFVCDSSEPLEGVIAYLSR